MQLCVSRGASLLRNAGLTSLVIGEPVVTATTSDGPPADAAAAAEQAAPLDALLVDAALGTYRRFAPNSSTVKWVARLAFQPRTTGRRLGDLVSQVARIG